MSYWRHHMCLNAECEWWYQREGAEQEAMDRCKRRMWRRAVQGRGKMHPGIEKVIKNRSLFALGTKNRGKYKYNSVLIIKPWN